MYLFLASQASWSALGRSYLIDFDGVETKVGDEQSDGYQDTVAFGRSMSPKYVF